MNYAGTGLPNEDQIAHLINKLRKMRTKKKRMLHKFYSPTSNILKKGKGKWKFETKDYYMYEDVDSDEEFDENEIDEEDDYDDDE